MIKAIIDYPLLGEIEVSQITTDTLKQKLYDGLLGRYLINPDVQVRILEYRPFYIRGEVENPSQYPYQPQTYHRKSYYHCRWLQRKS